MFSVNEATVYLGGHQILDNATFRIGDTERVAIVGPNGAGKSTLLKAIAGEIPIESGDLALPKGTTIGYLPQEADLVSDRTAREEMRSVFAEALEAFDQMADLEHRMGEIDHDSDEFRRIATRYDRLMATINRLDAYALDANIGQVSAGLGFSATDLDRPCREFSGGWQMRIALAKVLLSRPDVLLLDEPTNHLDLETMEWLEDWLLASRSAVLLVSHERSFMDRLTDRIFEIDRAQLTIYKGNYTDYTEERVERREHQARAYENQQREIERNQRFIDRFRAQANKASAVQSRVKLLEKMILLRQPARDQGTIHFNFPQPPRSGKEVVTISGVTHRYGDDVVFADVDWTAYRGERVALVGVNGAGKSTLMKIMAGFLKPTTGECEIGTKVLTQYFAQYEHDTLHPSWTVETALGSVAAVGEAQHARNVAGAFLFTGDDIDKPVRVLSGGERTRLRLAMMLFSPANLLLLDEPTNHLDVGSRQTLEDAMMKYTGTAVIVSHDRTFLDKVATQIIEVRDGRVGRFWGTYREYLSRHREEMGLVTREFPEGHHRLDAPGNTGGKDTVASSASPEEQALLDAINSTPQKLNAKQRRSSKRDQAESRRGRMQRTKPLRDRVRALERTIEENESRQSEIEQTLAKPETYTNPERAAQLGKEKKFLERELADAMSKWEESSQQLEAALSN